LGTYSSNYPLTNPTPSISKSALKLQMHRCPPGVRLLAGWPAAVPVAAVFLPQRTWYAVWAKGCRMEDGQIDATIAD
jgi:hypothetical protein